MLAIVSLLNSEFGLNNIIKIVTHNTLLNKCINIFQNFRVRVAEHLFLALHSTVTEHRKDNHKVEGTLNNHDDQTGNYWAEGKCSTTSLFFNDQVVNYYKHTGWLY